LIQEEAINMWSVRIDVELKKDVLDAQGKAAHQALLSLGFSKVKEVRVGKLIELRVEGNSREEIETQVRDMCKKLLSNPVIEDFKYEIEEQ
jgi:phosphoribosylformylglycinamidine synthase subunit PurS